MKTILLYTQEPGETTPVDAVGKAQMLRTFLEVVVTNPQFQPLCETFGVSVVAAEDVFNALTHPDRTDECRYIISNAALCKFEDAYHQDAQPFDGDFFARIDIHHYHGCPPLHRFLVILGREVEAEETVIASRLDWELEALSTTPTVALFTTPLIDNEKLKLAAPIWEEVEEATRRHAAAIRAAIPTVIDISTEKLRPLPDGFIVGEEVAVTVNAAHEVQIKISDWAIYDDEHAWDDKTGASLLREMTPDEVRLLAYALFTVADQAEARAQAGKGDTHDA